MEEVVSIHPLAHVAVRDWDSIRRSFRGRPTFEFTQSWRQHNEPFFAAGRVRVGLSGMALAVFATLRDRDVFNPVEHFNVPAFPHGDVFEIFVQPEKQTAYYEFHITPSGILTQLRWPVPMRKLTIDWNVGADPLLRYKINRWRIRAKVRLIRQGWEIHAEIPLARIFEKSVPWDGSHLRVGFGRYDYTRGRLHPVLSATPPLQDPDFHRIAEWHVFELRFC